MKEIYIYLFNLAASTAFGWTILLMNAYFLKERKVLKDMYIKLSRSVGMSVDNQPEMQDEAGRYHSLWHRYKGALYVAFSVTLALCTYFVTNKPLESSLMVPGVLFYLWSFGDVFLNWRMNWKLFERGDQSGMDVVPFWVRFCLLWLLIITLILI